MPTRVNNMNNSHQLNNSLAKIKIIFELIKDSNEKKDEYLKSLEAELKKIKELGYSLRCNS